MDVTDLSGQFGDYELQTELGRGGMGVVYLARQQSLGREVAVKMLLGGSSAGHQDRQRFRSEAEAAARLDHPHIVPVYEVGELDGRPYFSMKHIVGETLARRLQAGPLPAEDAVRLMLPLCSAVAAAHEKGILHRDLKPSNVLLDEAGTPFITDFGLAKQLDAGDLSLTESGAILGTPGYLSPEQASGGRQPVGPATDIYSLGAILYALLTGRAPFQGTTPVQTIMMVLEQEPIPPRVLNPQADADLQLIALKCLQKPADLRYASVRALKRDLRAWLNREPISARSSRFRDILNRAFRESPHAVILENWGVLWMWHALVLLVLCLTTNAMQVFEVTERGALRFAVDGGNGNLGRHFLEPPPSRRADHVCGAADRSYLGGQYGDEFAAVRGRGADGSASAGAVTGVGADRWRSVSGEGGDLVGAVLFAGRCVVRHGDCDGLARACGRTADRDQSVWSRLSAEFLSARVAVLPQPDAAGVSGAVEGECALLRAA